MRYYAMEGSNGEDDIDTDDGIQEDGFDTEGSSGENSVVSYIAQIYFCLNQNDIRTAYVRHETAAGVSGRRSTNRKPSLPSSYSCL